MIRQWRSGHEDLVGLLAESEQLAGQLRVMAEQLAEVANGLEAERGRGAHEQP